LSKVFKSHLCVTADPRQLELLDQEIFALYQQQPGSVAAELAEEEAEDPLGKARQEAEALLAETREQAERIRAAASLEARRIKSEAETAGRRTGLAEIRQELAGKLAQGLALLSTAELEHQRRVLASEPEILKLALAIAAKIINAELKLNPRQQLAMVQQVLQRFAQATVYKIRINPADLEQLTGDVRLELQSIFKEPKQIEIAPDPTIAPGGSFIETDHGNIDARLQTQMELVAKELLKIGNLV
jgi:flagellar assembly protein FliH